MLAEQWNQAEESSRAAGYPFFNRRGERENEKEDMMPMVIRTYLEDHGDDWFQVQEWKAGKEPQKRQANKRRGSEVRAKAKSARHW